MVRVRCAPKVKIQFQADFRKNIKEPVIIAI